MAVFPDRAPHSALYAHPFTVTTCPNNIRRVKLEICFCADDQLGDLWNGGSNTSGLYLNGHPVPTGSASGNFGPATTFATTVPASWVQTGANTLYLYNRDLGGGGVLYSARISILPCTPFILYGDGCRNPPPTLAMRNNPELGAALEVRIATGSAFTPTLTILGASDTTWGPVTLPLDLTALGATGCQLLASFDLQLPLWFTDALGEASFTLPIPKDLGLVDQTLFFQSVAADARANPLGLSLSAGHAVTVVRPGL